MNRSGRQMLYRVFWRLSEAAALADDLADRRDLVAAMFLIEELRTRGRVSEWNAKREAIEKVSACGPRPSLRLPAP